MRPEDQDDYRDRAGRADRQEAMPPILGQLVDLGHLPADDEKRHVYAFKALSGGFDRAEGGTIRLALVGEPLFAVDLTPPGAGAHPAVGDQHVLRWIADRLAFSAGSIGGMLSITVTATSSGAHNGFVVSKGDGSRFHIELYQGVWYNPDYDPTDPASGPETEIADPNKPSPFSDKRIYVPLAPFWTGDLADVPYPFGPNVDPLTGNPLPPPDPTKFVAGGDVDVYPGRRATIFWKLTDTADFYGYAYEQWGYVNFQNAGVQDVRINFAIFQYNITAQDRLKWLCPAVPHTGPPGNPRQQHFAGIAATFSGTAESSVNAQTFRVPLAGGEPIPTTWPFSFQTDTGEAIDLGHTEEAASSEGLVMIRLPPLGALVGGALGGLIEVDAAGYVPAHYTIHTRAGPTPWDVWDSAITILDPYPLLFCKDNMDGYTGTGDGPDLPPCFPRKLSLSFWKTAVSASMGTTANVARYPGCATKDGFEWLGDYAGEEVTIQIHNVVSPPAVSGVLPYVNYQGPCRKDYKQGRTTFGGAPYKFKSANLNIAFNPVFGGSGSLDVYYNRDDCTGGFGSLAGLELHFPHCDDGEDRPTTGPIYLWNAYQQWFTCYYYPNIFSSLPEPVQIYDLQIGVWSIED